MHALNTWVVLSVMTAEEFETHWRLLAQAVDTLLNLKPGEYPPISYEQTYSAVYKCVCQGFGEALYLRLLEEMERQLRLFRDRLQAVSDDGLIDSFNNSWQYFSCGLAGIVPIFNYLARFYVEAKLNANLRSELVKIFDKTVLQSILDRLFEQLHIAQNAPFAVQPSTMESVIRAMYKLRPNTVKELPDLYRRFIPELIQRVHVDELSDLQQEARRMITEARNSFGCPGDGCEVADLQSYPSIVGHGSSFPQLPEADVVMDFQMEETSVLEPTDPAISIIRRVKRPRSLMDSGDEGEDISSDPHVDPDEPSPSPNSVEQCRHVPVQAGVSDHRPRKHFHRDSMAD